MNNSNYTLSFKLEAAQQHDILIKILKENSEIFSYILCQNFNNSVFSKVFPSSLKKADITPFKKDEIFWKIVTGLLTFSQESQNSMNVVYTTK